MNLIFCASDSVPLNPDKLHRIIVAMPCISYLDHAASFAVVVNLHPLLVSAFASSRIGSRSGDVRYDEFSGCSSTILSGKQSTYTPAFLCGLIRVLWYLFSVMLMLSLSYILVTYPIHLSPQSKTILPPLPAYYPFFDVCLLCES